MKNQKEIVLQLSNADFSDSQLQAAWIKQKLAGLVWIAYIHKFNFP